MEASPSTSSMTDDVMAVDVLSSLLNPFENDVKRRHPKGPKACKKSSEIWDHYRLLNENQNVECVYCWKVLKRGDSSTKSMWGHMTAFHQDVLDDKQSRKKLRVMAVEPIERKKFPPTTDAEVGGVASRPSVVLVSSAPVNGERGSVARFCVGEHVYSHRVSLRDLVL